MSSPVNMVDAVARAANYAIEKIHTAMPGEIISYDYSTQKASIQPLLNRNWSSGSSTAPPNSINSFSTPFPVLENVPVIFPRAGGASLTFPVVEGDTCLLLFMERSIDQWLTTGGQVTPLDPRKYDLSDGVAIMGLFPFSETSKATNNNDVLLTYNGSSFRIKQNGDIVIETSSKIALGTSLVEVLQTISSALADIAAITTTVPSFGTWPITNAAAFTLLQAQIDSIKGTIP